MTLRYDVLFQFFWQVKVLNDGEFKYLVSKLGWYPN